MNKFGIFALIFSAIALGACSKAPTTFTTGRTDLFVVDSEDVYSQADKILQADYMFVVDVSASMGFNSGNPSDYTASKREEFMAGLDTFVNTLRTDKINYRIGFLNGNVNASRTSELDGRGFYKDILITSLMSATQQESLIQELQDIGQTLNQNTNLLLQAADEVMTNESTFVREGSQLIYLFVSDTDDESPSYFSSIDTSTTDYANRLINHKGSAANVPAFVNARAIVAGTKAGCDPAMHYGETEGTRLAETAAIIENRNNAIAGVAQNATPASVSHCILRASSEFPQLLQSLARDVSKPENLFKLQVKNVDSSTIKVYVDDFINPVPNSHWSYQAGTNAVKFDAAHVPASSSRIKLTYNQFYVLSATPKNPNKLSVKVDGDGIQLSGSNGWTYDAANNRIVFHGVTISNKTRIEVSYK